MYKAPMILVQSGCRAFAITPDVLSLTQKVLSTCNHAIDLDVPAGPALSVGFTPARLLFHSVYREEVDQIWTAEDVVENSYFLYVAGAAPPRQAYRDVVRFHWSKFGSAELTISADQQAGTEPKFLSCKLWDDWRRIV
jgi:hypothetical protein